MTIYGSASWKPPDSGWSLPDRSHWYAMSRTVPIPTGRMPAVPHIEIACSPAPEGHSRWTLRLLEEQAKIALDVPVSKDTIGRALKKNKLRPHMNDYWCIPSKEDDEMFPEAEKIILVMDNLSTHP